MAGIKKGKYQYLARIIKKKWQEWQKNGKNMAYQENWMARIRNGNKENVKNIKNGKNKERQE